jgi:proteasome accessory factor C
VDADRLFRVDRIQAVRATGEEFEPRGDDGTAVADAVFHPSPEDPRVTLELTPDAGWVVESYPCEEAEERPDGSWRVVLAISERAWLERLLLRLGPDARVMEPPGLRAAAAEAARRLLGRYRGGVGG